MTRHHVYEKIPEKCPLGQGSEIVLFNDLKQVGSRNDLFLCLELLLLSKRKKGQLVPRVRLCTMFSVTQR